MTLRCSHLDRVLSCPGGLTLVPLCPERVSGPEAEEGTALHYLAHQRIIDELGAVGDIGAPPPIPNVVAFSKWIADFYFSTVKELTPPDWSLECEAEMVHDFARFTLSGHLDDIALSPDVTEARIFDLKAGYDPVDPADENEQCLGYAVLAKLAYPTLKKVSAVIVQPRNDPDSGYQRVSPPMILEGDMLERAASVLEARINAALDNANETDSGKKQCNWCPVALTRPHACPSLRQELMKAQITSQDIDALTNGSDTPLADFVIAGRLLDKPVEAATELLKERIRKNGYVDSSEKRITIKTRPGPIKIADPVEFMKQARIVLPEDERIAQAVSFSKTKLVEQVADRLGIPKTSKQGECADAVVKAHLAPYWEQSEVEMLVIS